MIKTHKHKKKNTKINYTLSRYIKKINKFRYTSNNINVKKEL